MFKFISLSQAASVYAAAFSSLSLTNKFFIAAVFVNLALAGCGGGGVGSSSASTSGSQPIYGGDIGGGDYSAEIPAPIRLSTEITFARNGDRYG